MKLCSLSKIILSTLILYLLYGNLLAQPWSYTVTNSNHTIILLNDSNNYTINGQAIETGDVIGVFYTDSTGNLACAGYFSWYDFSPMNASMAAYGAFEIDNGFNQGEKFEWKIWQASTNTVFNAEATYNTALPDSAYFNDNGLSLLTTLNGSSQASPAPWSYTVTNSSHLIILLNDANNYLIDNQPIQPGDFMGVFFEDSLGGLQCGGYFEWYYFAPNNEALAAFGAFQADNGFMPGEEFYWKVWRASDSTELDAVATYNPLLPDQENFIDNGISMLASLNTESVCDTPLITIHPVSHTVCEGESHTFSVTATGTAPLIYTWIKDGTDTVSVGKYFTIDPVTIDTAGDYSCIVSNACGSDTSNIAVLTVNPSPNLTISGLSSVCEGNSTTLDAGVFNSYNWSTSASTQSIVVSASGAYSVTVTDGNGCTDIDTFQFSLNQNPQLYLGNDTSLCDGENLTLDAGFYDAYQWSGGASTQTILVSVAGEYSVTVTDSNSCQGSDTILLSVNQNPVVDLGNDTAICDGEILMIDAPSFDSYIWSNGASTQSINVSIADSYSVTVTDSNGCQDSDTLVLFVNQNPIINLGSDTSICKGESLILDAGTFVSYLWSNGSTTQTISVSTAGSYSVTVTDGNGCEGSDTLLLSIYQNPVVDLGNDTSLCEGGVLVLDAGIFNSYNWSTNESSQTISVSTDATYSVTVMDANGCEDVDSMQLTVYPSPAVDLGNDTSVCIGQSVILDAGSYNSYIWSTSATNQFVTASTTGSYSVTVEDSNGCEGSDTLELSVTQNLVVDLGNDTSICDGESLVLDAGVFHTYDWSTSASTQTINVLTTGIYSISVTDASGCDGADTILVTVNQNPVVDLANDTSICDGEILIIDAGTFDSYTWSTGTSTQAISVSVTGDYSVTVSDINACTDRDTISVSVKKIISVQPPQLYSDQSESFNITCEYTNFTTTQATIWMNKDANNIFASSIQINSDLNLDAYLSTTCNTPIGNWQMNMEISPTCTLTYDYIEVIPETIPPNAFCKDTILFLDAVGAASVTAPEIDNGSVDTCGIATLSLNKTSFSCIDVGANAVILTVTDNSNNIATCSSTVTVVDTISPIANCKDTTLYLNTSGQCSVTAIEIDNGSSDACSIASRTLDKTAFTCPDVGLNTIILTITDNNNNSSTCPSSVTVIDTINPVAICHDTTLYLNSSGQVSVTAAEIDNGSFDNCGIASLSLNQTNFGCIDLGANTVTLSVTDVNGNISTCPATVTVVDNNAPISIIIQPQSSVNCFQGDALLSVVANGLTALSYQWNKDGSPILGADSSSLQLNNLDYSDAGIYTCDITQFCSTVQSDPATIVVNSCQNVCGTIASNTTWNIDTVRVTCDVLVIDNVTLTIAPGTVVEFQGHNKLNVFGTLLAEGTVNDSIKFTAANTSTGWHGIRIDNSSLGANGAMNDNDSTILAYCRIEYGKATGTSPNTQGGAIYINSFDKVRVSNSCISYNSANSIGGALYMNASSPVIKNNIFSHNNSGANGGAMFFLSCTPIFSNNIISNNSASNTGGGLYLNSSSPAVNNNTFTNNTASFAGGVYLQASSPTLKNTIVWGNNGGGANQLFWSSGSNPSVDYCNVESGTDFGGTGTYSNNIDSDPLFANPTTSAGVNGVTGDGLAEDWGLTKCSPSINTGTPVTTGLNVEPDDLAGNPRTQHGVVDMGALEFQGVFYSLPIAACPVTQNVCINGGLVDLTSIGATPSGGTFTWTGGSGNSFDPIAIGAGNHTVNYEVSNLNNCTDDCDFTIHVYNAFTPGAIETTDETICYDGDPSSIGSSTDASGGDETITYQWQSSTDNFATTSTDIGSSNSASYDPPANLTVTTWYRRQAKDGMCNTSWETSTGVWKVTVYNDFTAGAISTTGETICYDGDPSSIGSSTDASGGDEAITYQWQSSTDNFATAPTDISSSNSASYDPPANLTVTTCYRRQAKDGTCNPSWESSSGVWKVTVYNDFTAGAIFTTGETICYNGDPSSIGSSTDASGGDGSITYQWQSSTDNFATAPTDISSSNSAGYDPPANLTVTTWYRRQAKDGTCNTSWESSLGVWKVTVYNDFTAGAISTTGETICYDGDPSSIGSSTDASGGDGSITYQWQSSTDNFATAPTDISSSNSASYDPPANLTVTTWYRRQAKDGTCNTSWESSLGVWKVTVYNDFTAGAIFTTGETICYGDDPALIGSSVDASGGDEAITYQWQSSTDNFATAPTDISSSNSASYDPPANLTVTTWYRRQAKDGTCITNWETSSGVWKVSVYNDFTAGAIFTTGEAICYDGDPSSIGSSTDASGGDEAITYQWQSSTDNFATTPTDIGSSNSASYDPPANLTEATWYRRQAKDGTCNKSWETSTGVWKVSVDPLPTAGIISNAPLCVGEDLILRGMYEPVLCESNCSLPQTYCASGSNLPFYEYISQVNLADSTNNSTFSGYDDQTSGLFHILYLDSTYALSVEINNYYNYLHYTNCFIDWNRDGDFDDPGEKTELGSGIGNQQLNGMITVPANAVLGQTMMRVVNRQNLDAQACGSYPIGETEDYLLEIRGMDTQSIISYAWSGPAGSSTAQNWTIAGVTPVESGSYNLTVTNTFNCCSVASVQADVLNPQPNLGADTLYTMFPDTLQFDPGLFDSYQWNTGASTQQISGENYGTYKVTVSELQCASEDSVWVGEIQNIGLREGWGMFSTYINTPLEMHELFSDFTTKPIIVKDDAGQVYWDFIIVDQIGLLQMNKGYMIKMANDDELIVYGDAYDETSPVSLAQGYNIISYLRKYAAPVDEIFSDVVNHLFLVKDQDGAVYWPIFQVNMIGDMENGQGYIVKMNQADTVIYPANSTMFAKSSIMIESPEYYSRARNTGENMTLGIPLEAWDVLPENGDEVAVFTKDGDLIGSAVFQGGHMAFPVWSKDFLDTQSKGLSEAEAFDLYIYHQASDEQQKLEVTEWLEGDGTYTRNGVAVVGKMISDAQAHDLSGMEAVAYPNPFRSELEIVITLPESSDISVSLYNVLGQKVEELYRGSYTQGTHQIRFDAARLTAGSYYLRFESNDESKLIKLTKMD